MVKKTSDIIQKLEEQVDYLVKVVNNQNNIIKMILKSINEIKSSFNVKNTNIKTEPSFAIGESFVPEAEGQMLSNLEKKALHAKKMDENSHFEMLKQQAGIDDDDDINDPNHASNVRRGQRVNNTVTNNKIAVTQIVSSNGLPVPLAQVTVMNRFGEVIATTRTNQKGRWTTSVEPGDYEVNVKKIYPKESQKTTINKTYSIKVEQTRDNRLELEPN